MKNILAVLLLLLSAAQALTQEVRLPTEVKGAVGSFIVINAETTDPSVKWFSVDSGLNLFPQQLLKDTKVAVATALVPGRYRVLAVSAKSDTPSDFALCTVVVGDAPPLPPPGPGPGPQPPPPGPQPPPVTTGARLIYLIRESSEQTSQQSDLIRAFRNPTTEAYKYLSSKRHTFIVADPHESYPGGVTADTYWRGKVPNITYPALIILDEKLNALGWQPLPNNVSDPKVVLDAIQKTGG